MWIAEERRDCVNFDNGYKNFKTISISNPSIFEGLNYLIDHSAAIRL